MEECEWKGCEKEATKKFEDKWGNEFWLCSKHLGYAVLLEENDTKKIKEYYEKVFA